MVRPANRSTQNDDITTLKQNWCWGSIPRGSADKEHGCDRGCDICGLKRVTGREQEGEGEERTEGIGIETLY